MRSLFVAIMANCILTACISQGPFFHAKDLDLIVSEAASSKDIIAKYGQPIPKETVDRKKQNYEPTGEPINLELYLSQDSGEMESLVTSEDNAETEWGVSLQSEYEGELLCPQADYSINYLAQRIGWLVSVEEQYTTIFFDQNARACGYQLQTYMQTL